MKVLKYTVLSFICVIILIVICSYFSASNISSYTFALESRKTIISKPQDEVYNYISHIDNKKDWINNDNNQNIERNSTGKDGTVGFCRTWKINNPHEEGKETILALQKNVRVETEVENNLEGKLFANKQIFTCKAINSFQTEVTWQYEFTENINFITQLSFGFTKLFAEEESDAIIQQKFNERMISEGYYEFMDNALANLKSEIEKR